MSKSSDNNRNRLQDEFDIIQASNDNINLSMHLAKIEHLPDLGEINIYDYDADIESSNEQSKKVLGSLVDLYLDDIPKLKEHPYIKNKMKEDSMVYSEAIFLTKMTRKNFLNQLKQVDNGDNSARMHEVINQTIGQIRENTKFLSSRRTELEKFYKSIRSDLGYDSIAETEIETKIENKDGLVMDNRKLNDMIKNAMNKDNKKSEM